MYQLGMLWAEHNNLSKVGFVFPWRSGVPNRYGDSAMPSGTYSSKFPFLTDLFCDLKIALTKRGITSTFQAKRQEKGQKAKD